MKTVILYSLLIYFVIKFIDARRKERKEREMEEHIAARKYLSGRRGIEVYNLFVDGLLKNLDKSGVDHPELFKKLSSLEEFDSLGTAEKEVAEYIVKKLILGGEEFEERIRSRGIDE